MSHERNSYVDLSLPGKVKDVARSSLDLVSDVEIAVLCFSCERFVVTAIAADRPNMPHAVAKTSATAGVRPRQSAFLKRQRSQPRSRKAAATNLIDFFTRRSQKAAFKPSELKQIGPLKVSPMGLGTWSWGNQLLWGYDKSMDAELQEVFNLMVSKGINIFDTADSYGEHTY